MKVKTIHLVPSERVNGPEDVLLRIPLSSNIQVESTVLKFRLIKNRDRTELGVHDTLEVLRVIKQLGHCGEGVKHTIAGWSSDVCRVAIERNCEIVALVKFTIFRRGGGLRFCLFDCDLLNFATALGPGLEFFATTVEFPWDELLLEDSCLRAIPCIAYSSIDVLIVLFGR